MKKRLMVYKNLAVFCKEKGLTQRELAVVLHVEQNTSSQYEASVLKVPADVLTDLADFYQTSTDYPLDHIDERRPYS